MHGDFNAILSQSNKQGRRPVGSSSSSGNGFHNFILNSGMVDIGFSGNPFTWANGRFGDAFIQERLDRVVANGDWRLKFPRATLKDLPHTSFDHAMILLDTLGEQNVGPHQFRFESFWTRNPDSVNVVKSAWTFFGHGSPTFVLVNCRKNTS